MADQEYTQISGDPKLKDAKAPTAIPFTYTDEEQTEKDQIDDILEARQTYSHSRLAKEREWTDSYRMYMSYIDTARNSFLSNLFIPKTHEAVETLAAFLIGTNQSIDTAAENNGDSYKAQVAGKWLDFLWRKVVKARIKILTWIKQGIVFGNGILKVGWDDENKKPFMVNTAIEDVYFDYFQPDLQESEYIIHEVRRMKEDVKTDDKYDAKDGEGNFIRNDVVEGGESPYTASASYKFSSYDKSLVGEVNQDKVVLVEAWCKKGNKMFTLGPTSIGWRVLRSIDNPYFYQDGDKHTPFRPFSKLRFKSSPLANRAYDMGGVYPTVKIQRAFNDLINQYFDNVVIINNAMWIKRRGARINPSELVRKAGGVITVGDINADLKTEVTPDIKQSIVEMLNRLDGEFQQASMVMNLLKGIDSGTAKTASEVQLGQQNSQTLLDMIDENIAESLSEVGDMLLNISLQNTEGKQQITMFETDTHTGVMEFDPKDIISRYNTKISADRSAGTSKVVRQKQLLDFINIISPNQTIQAKFPMLIQKTLEKWLEEAGFHDTKFFFDAVPPATPAPALPAPGQGSGGGMPMPGMDKLLTEAAAMRSAQPPTPTA